MFQGSRWARHLLCDHLEEHAYLVAGRHRNAGIEVPDVAEWVPHWKPRAQVEAWPVVLVTTIDGRHVASHGPTTEGPDQRWRWNLRTFAWVRGESFAEVADHVEGLAAVLVEIMLAHPGLADGASIEPNGMRVSLSDVVTPRRVQGSIAAAAIDVVVTLDEVATVPPIAVADTLTAIVHPALD